MTTTIKQLKDEDGDAFYPQTVKAAIPDLGTIPTLVTLTQAQYDALATKDPDTYYFIKES